MSLGDDVTGDEVTCVGGDAGLGGLMSLGDNVKVDEVTWVGGDAGGLVSLGDNVTGEEVTWVGGDAGIAPWTGDWDKGEGKVKFEGGVVVPVPSMGEKGGKGDGVKLGGGVAGLVCLGDGFDGGGGRGGESGGSVSSSVLREGASPSNVRSVISAVPALVSSIIALSI